MKKWGLIYDKTLLLQHMFCLIHTDLVTGIPQHETHLKSQELGRCCHIICSCFFMSGNKISYRWKRWVREGKELCLDKQCFLVMCTWKPEIEHMKKHVRRNRKKVQSWEMRAWESERQSLLQRGKVCFCSHCETSWMKMSFCCICATIHCNLLAGNKLFERKDDGPVTVML